MRTVALLARRPGLRVLRDTLARLPAIELTAVFTHGRLPAVEGGGARDEVPEFQALCDKLRVPLVAVDGPHARDVSSLLPSGPLDLLLSLSWRYLVPQHVLSRFHRTVNIHRGALPKYAGVIPVQRAIEAGETQVAITAHEMTSEIDAGRKIAEVWRNVVPCPSGRSAADHAEIVKLELEPLYAPLAWLAIMALRQG
jgi:methionyl-tRNA formyltransferase